MLNSMINNLANNIGIPLTPDLFFSVRYVENIHLYFWLLKDLAWSLRYTDFGMTFGTIAVLFLGVLYYNAIKTTSSEEILYVITMTFWLIGNYLWMMGELQYDDDGIARPRGRALMIVGICIQILYHILVKWLKVITLTPNEKSEQLYNETGLKSRFEYFTTFRQYEHFHMFCWLGKDLCWNADIQELWILFVLPTFFISADFIYLASKNKKMVIDLAHYVSQFIWVTANIAWAYQELFLLSMTDKPQYLPHPNVHSFRWGSSLLLVLAWVPIGILYFVWIPLTLSGKINDLEQLKMTNNIEMYSEIQQHPDIAKKFPQNNNFEDDDIEL